MNVSHTYETNEYNFWIYTENQEEVQVSKIQQYIKLTICHDQEIKNNLGNLLIQ